MRRLGDQHGWVGYGVGAARPGSSASSPTHVLRDMVEVVPVPQAAPWHSQWILQCWQPRAEGRLGQGAAPQAAAAGRKMQAPRGITLGSAASTKACSPAAFSQVILARKCLLHPPRPARSISAVTWADWGRFWCSQHCRRQDLPPGTQASTPGTFPSLWGVPMG